MIILFLSLFEVRFPEEIKFAILVAEVWQLNPKETDAVHVKNDTQLFIILGH